MSRSELHLPLVSTPVRNKDLHSLPTNSKHSFRDIFLPSTQISRLEKFQSQMDLRMSELSAEPPKRYNRQYFRIPTQNTEKAPNTDKEIIAQLQNNSEDPYEDEKPKEIIGESAIKQYYQHYKKINRVKEQNMLYREVNKEFQEQQKLSKIPNSVQTNLIQKAEELKLLPCKLGVIRTKGEKNALQLQNQKFGDQYALVLSEGLKGLPVITDFNLNQNRISEAGASQILPLISKQARAIELLSNHIGKKGLEPVFAVLPLQNCKIQILNLEDNALGDSLVVELCKCLSKNLSVEKLNLSKNQITNQAASVVREMLEKNESLVELYLHWNSIKGVGGAEIIKTLQPNKTMRVLDFSYNLLGCGQSQIGAVLKEFFIENKVMMHIDLSANGFSFQDCNLIADGLKQNHSVYGFHFAGNYGYVDTKGFLILENNMRNFNQIHVEQRIRGVDENCKPYEHAVRQEKVRDTCWICDGWQSATFQWIPNQSGGASEEPIFIHFDYEGYEAIFLGRAQSDGTFQTHRMVPSTDIQYFYTANSMQMASQCEEIRSHNEKFRTKVVVVEQLTDIMLDETNMYRAKRGKPVIVDWDPSYDVLPRTPDPVYVPARRKKAKRVWTYPISIWAPKYKFETDDLLRKCFEKDWSCSKISKFVKKEDELAQVKEMLWQAYKPIKECYKYYASLNPNGDVFSMSQNPTSEFVNACGLIDGKNIKLADIDLKFIATCSASQQDYKGNIRNPERALVRYQLMEFLVRVAEDKYVRNQQGVNMVQATRMMLDQCLPHMATFDCHKWRMERYFIEQCDDVCKKYKQIFDYIYLRNSQKKVKPGQPPFMCMDELKEICNRAGIFDENFVDRDVNIAFNLSMMVQVDELESNRIFEMQWIEFLEAIARVAEKYSPVAIGKQAEREWTYEARFAQPLYYKLEAFIIHLINRLVDDETKKNIKIPTVSMFDVEEEDQYY